MMDMKKRNVEDDDFESSFENFEKYFTSSDPSFLSLENLLKDKTESLPLFESNSKNGLNPTFPIPNSGRSIVSQNVLANGQNFLPTNGQNFLPTNGQKFLPINGQNFLPTSGFINMPSGGHGTISSMSDSTPPVVSQFSPQLIENTLPYRIINSMPNFEPPQALSLNLSSNSVNSLLDSFKPSNQKERINRMPSSIPIDRRGNGIALTTRGSSSMAPRTWPPRQAFGKQPFPPPPPPPSGGAGQEGRWRIRKTPPAMLEKPAKTDGQRLKRIMVNREPTIEAKEEKRLSLFELEQKQKNLQAESMNFSARLLQMKRQPIRLDALNYNMKQRWINAGEQLRLQNSLNEAKRNDVKSKGIPGLGNQHLRLIGLGSSSRDRSPAMHGISAMAPPSQFHLQSLHKQQQQQQPSFASFKNNSSGLLEDLVMNQQLTPIPNQHQHQHQHQNQNQNQLQHHHLGLNYHEVYNPPDINQSPELQVKMPQQLQQPNLSFHPGHSPLMMNAIPLTMPQSASNQVQSTPFEQELPELDLQELKGLLQFPAEFEQEQCFWVQQLQSKHGSSPQNQVQIQCEQAQSVNPEPHVQPQIQPNQLGYDQIQHKHGQPNQFYQPLQQPSQPQQNRWFH